ncbi:uncharacterized protein LOC127778647 [Oryza glaberrima]|uniref:Uncharacterized protein n=1 Tax=Oryza glaberrima TaxID=4538 RepID=I1QD56_ORYGL|nr:uncharacterized protein LOC127778647 [Oryza glaberrima]
MAVMKSQLVLATLFLAGLVARGAEASIAGVVYCSLQCLTLPNLLPKATVRLQINSYEIPTAGNQGFIRRNSKGQFVVLLNVTSSEMMGSLMSGSGRVAVIAPPPAARGGASLPAAAAAGGTTLVAPVVPHGARILGATAADNTLRQILDQLQSSSDLLPGLAQGLDYLLNNATMEVLRELADDIVPTGVSYGGDTVDAYVAFDVGPFS